MSSFTVTGNVDAIVMQLPDGKRRVAGTDEFPSRENIPLPTPEELHALALQEAENSKAQLLVEVAEITR